MEINPIKKLRSRQLIFCDNQNNKVQTLEFVLKAGRWRRLQSGGLAFLLLEVAVENDKSERK